jgi:hypothetical protein
VVAISGNILYYRMAFELSLHFLNHLAQLFYVLPWNVFGLPVVILEIAWCLLNDPYEKLHCLNVAILVLREQLLNRNNVNTFISKLV